MRRQPLAVLGAPARIVILGILLKAPCAAAQAAAEIASGSYVDLSLEQLMNVDVTSVAGTPGPRFEAPAALAVISGDDIRRAGHRTVVEALRMVPGMFVARVNASSYVAGARGLAGSAITSTRYLVMMDGRAVHDPLISTAFWDVVDVPMDLIDRIEVIRGPGATLWGANATHGVVNIVTREADQSQGTLLTTSVGTTQSHATLSHGFVLGETALRAYVKYADHADFELTDGSSAHDAYSTVRAGVRADRSFGRRTRVTVDAAAYDHPTADVLTSLPVPGVHSQFEQRFSSNEVRGAHLLLRAEHQWSKQAGLRLKAYVDSSRRDTASLGIHRDSIDLDLRQWTLWSEHNELIGGIRFTRHDDRLMNGDQFRFTPESRRWDSVDGFVQNTTELIPARVFLMLGSKLSHHDFVGSFAQPGARLWWTPSPQRTLWAAVSRPVRVPSRLENDGFITLAYADTGLAVGMPATGVIQAFGLGGHNDLKTERLTAYELGHRYRLRDQMALDVSLFYNDYQRLIGVPAGIIGSFTDAGKAQTYGVELAATLYPTAAWKIDAAYSYLGTDVEGPVADFDEDNLPRHLAQVRASWSASDDLEAHSALYYVPQVDGLSVDAYTRVDLGMSWQVREGLELSLWGQNLAEAEHQESGGVEIPRSLYAQLQLEL